MDQKIAKSALRAIDVVTYLIEMGRPMRAVDISRALDLPASSTDQLLKTLTTSGHLIFVPTGKTYFPSAAMAKFASRLADAYDYPRLERLVREISARTGFFSSAAVQNDCFAQIVTFTHPPGSPALSIHGKLVPLVGSIMGAAILAGKPKAEFEALIQRIRRLRVETWMAPDQRTVGGLIHEFRYLGYAWGNKTIDVDGRAQEVMTLAVPLPANMDGVCMSVGLAGFSERMADRRHELYQTIRACVDAYWLDPDARRGPPAGRRPGLRVIAGAA